MFVHMSPITTISYNEASTEWEQTKLDIVLILWAWSGLIQSFPTLLLTFFPCIPDAYSILSSSIWCIFATELILITWTQPAVWQLSSFDAPGCNFDRAANKLTKLAWQKHKLKLNTVDLAGPREEQPLSWQSGPSSSLNPQTRIFNSLSKNPSSSLNRH